MMNFEKKKTLTKLPAKEDSVENQVITNKLEEKFPSKPKKKNNEKTYRHDGQGIESGDQNKTYDQSEDLIMKNSKRNSQDRGHHAANHQKKL